MGTRELSDVLFDDEIIKLPDESANTPSQLHAQVCLPQSNEMTSSITIGKDESKSIESTLDPLGSPVHETSVEEKVLSEHLSLEEGEPWEDRARPTVSPSHHVRVHEPKPGYIAVGDRPHTPDFIKTTEEVASSAAALDPREPSPPISDGEAGHDGYRRMSSTPILQVASTAAEVADVAAILDDREDTPPVSDEEAGRIGYRRMSNTPIPQVANTAAEVADVAATLDHDAEVEAAMVSLHPPERIISRQFIVLTIASSQHLSLFLHQKRENTSSQVEVHQRI
jgi:hypothetical protein